MTTFAQSTDRQLVQVDPLILLAPERLDIIVKYLFIKSTMEGEDAELNTSLYKRHIIRRTGGIEDEKRTVGDYLESFKKLINEVKANGFNKQFCIPMSQINGILLNGAHRAAACLYFGIKPFVEYIPDQKGLFWDHSWFEAHDFSETEIEHLLQTYIRLKNENTFALILWGPISDYWREVQTFISESHRIIAVKEFSFDAEMLSNVVRDIYSYEVGAHTNKTIEDKIGILKKYKHAIRLILVHVDNPQYIINSGREVCSQISSLKKAVRQRMHHLMPEEQFITIHTADNSNHVKHIMNILLNEHNLEFARLRPQIEYRKEFLDWLEECRRIVTSTGIGLDNYCIVGSSPLEVLGIRNSTDIDIIVASSVRSARYHDGVVKLSSNMDIVTKGYHKSLCSASCYSDDQLIYDRDKHFYFRGFKFADLRFVHERKMVQGRSKDKIDVIKINKFLAAGQKSLRKGQSLSDWFLHNATPMLNAMRAGKAKRNIIILNCCPLGENETRLWNQFHAAYCKHVHIKFFSTANSEHLDFRDKISIDYDQIFFEPESVLDEDVEIYRTIADYDNIWDTFDSAKSFRKAYSWYAFWRLCLKIFSPVAVYIWNGYHVPEAALAKAADSIGVPKYYVERGPFANTYSCDSRGINYASEFVREYDRLACDTQEESVREFARAYLGRGESNWGQPGLSKSREEFLGKHGIPADRCLLFFPSQVDTDSNSRIFSPHYKSVLDAYESVARETGRFAGRIFLLAKQHPVQKNGELFKKVPLASGKWIEDAHIFDCIRFCDAVVSINSSSAVEAAVLGKPILILGQSIMSPNTKAIHLQEKGQLGTTIQRLIEICGTGAEQIDFDYFSKLLTRYLYTPLKEYQDLGVLPVSRMPVPASGAARCTSLTASEAELISSLLSVMESSQRGRKVTDVAGLDHLQKELAARDSRMVRMQQEINAKDNRIAEMQKVLDERERCIKSLLGSYSWKVTAPLRSILGMVRKGGS